jgi:hypothetical protein
MTNLQKEVIKLLKQGLIPSDVAKKLNKNKSTVHSVIKRYPDIIGNYNKTMNTCDHNYFDNINTEEKAYLLGFFIADGYISTNSTRMGVLIQSNDDVVLKCIQSSFAPNNKIYTKNLSTNKIIRKTQSKIRWCSVHMKNILINKYKILPNKTYDSTFNFPFETIPNNLKRHFIRGFIDGDGSFESHNGIFTMTLVGTSQIFMQQFGEQILLLDNDMKLNIKEVQGKTINWFTLRFNMFGRNKPEKVMKIYNYLYQDSTIFLQRKKDKIESYLKYRGKL